MSFDILVAELYCNSKALYNKGDPSALKHNVIHVAPSNWTENVRRERTGDGPGYERNIRFTKVAEFLEECWIEHEERGEVRGIDCEMAPSHACCWTMGFVASAGSQISSGNSGLLNVSSVQSSDTGRNPTVKMKQLKDRMKVQICERAGAFTLKMLLLGPSLPCIIMEPLFVMHSPAIPGRRATSSSESSFNDHVGLRKFLAFAAGVTL